MKLQPVHRARRFVRSVIPRRPTPADLEWAHAQLSDPERRVFDRMAAVDRSHSIRVARSAERMLAELGGDPSERSWVLAAALLHDVGKQVAGLGTYGRVVATLSGSVGGASMGPIWAERSGLTRRVGLYLQYPQLGADLLGVAGSDQRVVAWAREHHLAEQEWTVPLEEGRLLRTADDEAS